MPDDPNISIYACEDGTEFPVEWPSEDAPNYTWRWNEDHHPHPLAPLIAALDHGRKPGGDRAYEEAGLIAPHMFREWTIANGFQYVRASPLPPEEMGPFVARGHALAARFGGPCKIWEGYSLPRVRDACERLRALPPASSVHDAMYLHDYAFQLTHVAGPAVLFPIVSGLERMLSESLGAEGALLAHEVTQGGANDTVASDQAIWELAQLARAEPLALEAVMSATDQTRGVAALPDTSPFRRAFERYVDTYRWRTEILGPDWADGRRKPGPCPVVYTAGPGRPVPGGNGGGWRSTPTEAIARIERELADRPEQLQRFRETVQSLEGYVGVREGRALWQLIATGSLRHALLAKGRALVDAGTLEGAEDVFCLHPEEVDAATGGEHVDYQARVEKRRGEWEYWKTKRPPQFIGAPPSGPLPFPLPVASTGPVLRGIPASRGVVTARVRVVANLAETDAFEPGEVLVCAMTSPPWTPLFTIAAAVVTDSGAPLSHPAITAREYGIPCVVGAKDASRKLRTGMLVTVDGLAGTVTILEPDDS